MGNWLGRGGSGSACRHHPCAGHKHWLVTTRVPAREPGRGAWGHAAPEGDFMGCSDPKNGERGQIPQRGAWGPQRGRARTPQKGCRGPWGAQRPSKQGAGTPKRGAGCRDEETPPKMDAGTLRGEKPQISERVQGPQRRGQRDCRGAEGVWGVQEPQGAAETTVSPGDLLVPFAAHHGQSSGYMVALGMWWLWGHVVALRMR